jgi:hypothetical protein
MTLLMRVHGIECDPYDPEKFRLQLPRWTPENRPVVDT